MASRQALQNAQKLFVAFYNRPGDSAGIQFWANQIDSANGSLAGIIDAFADSAEAASLFTANQSTEDRINTIYQNILGRDADPDGLAFYAGQINSGDLTLPRLSLNILEGVTGADIATLTNRLSAANAFTNEVQSQSLNYVGNEAAAIARTYLRSIQSSLEERIQAADLMKAYAITADVASQLPDLFRPQVSSQSVVDPFFVSETITRDNAPIRVNPPLQAQASQSLETAESDVHGSTLDESATSIRLGDGPVSGFLQSRSDSDVFSVSLNKGQRYVLTTTNPADDGSKSFDELAIFRIKYLDKNGNERFVDSFLDHEGGTSQFLFYAPTDGVNYIEVVNPESGEVLSPNQYTLKISEYGGADDHVDVRDMDATVLASGLQQTGKIELHGDSDIFRFEMRASEQYRITVTNTSDTATPFDENVYFSVFKNGFFLDGQGAQENGEGVIEGVAQTTGTYFLKVQGSSIGGAENDSYTVNLTKTPPVGGFNPAAEGQPGFQIALNLDSSVIHQEVFRAAADKAASLVNNDLPDVMTAAGMLIDDLLINFSVGAIDGGFNTAAFAQATGLRSPEEGRLAYDGRIKVDEADIERFFQNGQLEDLLVHEILHLMGVGATGWSHLGLNVFKGEYTGEHALNVYRELSGDSKAGFVPLENSTGSSASDNSHWAESVFKDEIMSPLATTDEAISRLTLAGLADLGYDVNFNLAEPFTLS